MPRTLRDLLPWYVNGTLSPGEQQAMRDWLRDDPQAAAELATWQQVEGMVVGQAVPVAPEAAWARVAVQLQARGESRRSWNLARLAVSAALVLAFLGVLWAVVRPGIWLEWSVAAGTPSAFRVYRAPVGISELRLVGEVPARAQIREYRFFDPFPLPANRYVYRVDAVGPAGQPTDSRTVVGEGWSAFPGQLTVVLASLVLAYCVQALAHTSRLSGRKQAAQ